MFFFTALLAAGSLPTLITGTPVPSSHTTDHVKRVADAYVMYSGSGDMSAGWPAQSAWVSSFDALFQSNRQLMTASCAQWGVPNDSDGEIADVKSAILRVASDTGVDARFILAIMMQESGGCVRAPTTNWGVRNPGLMQDHDGTGTCNENGVLTPCPASQILQMIKDGVAGTAAGDGLVQTMQQARAADDSRFYKGARIYNSGSVDPSGDLGKGIATHCYASDIANRLTGWVTAPHGRCLDGGACTASAGPSVSPAAAPSSAASSAAPSSSAAPAPAPSSSAAATSVAPAAASSSASSSTPASSAAAASPTASPTASSAVTTTPSTRPITSTTLATSTTTRSSSSTSILPSSSTSTRATSSTFSTSNTSSTSTRVSASAGTSTGTSTSASASASPRPGTQPSAPKAPGAVSPCYQWYTVAPGDYCWLVQQKFGISFDQLRRWNGGLDSACSNLWLGYAYCVRGPN